MYKVFWPWQYALRQAGAPEKIYLRTGQPNKTLSDLSKNEVLLGQQESGKLSVTLGACCNGHQLQKQKPIAGTH